MSTFKASIILQEAVQKDYFILKEALDQQAFRISSPESIDAAANNEIIATKQGGIQEVTGSLLEAVRATGKKFSFTIIKHKN